VKLETCIACPSPTNEIMSRIEEATKPLGFNVDQRNYKVMVSISNLYLLIIISSFFHPTSPILLKSIFTCRGLFAIFYFRD